MIYSKELTKDLINIFGTDVLSWSKHTIRLKIEDKVEESKKALLKYSKNNIVELLTYQKYLELDNTFTENYIFELEILENES
jgi:hypothetical protein